MFEEYENKLRIEGKLSNAPLGIHGIHIHEYGKTGNGCLDAGGHCMPAYHHCLTNPWQPSSAVTESEFLTGSLTNF